MNQEQIHELETKLWDAADQLRASSKLTAAEYKDPVLGLVLLRFAQNRYEEAKPIVEKNLPVNPRTGKKREATANDFLSVGAMKLPKEAKYDYLANLPASKDIANEINNSMKLIEAEYPDLSGILPKNYQEFESDLLHDLIRVFNKDAVKKATGDVFGRIYEYFLMKFSMQGAGAQEGGEFFTPPSLVQLIVNFIEPDHGIIHDPACGSGGMFVQTGYFVRNHSNKEVNEAIKCYGTEQKTNNTKLAKMNLAIHGIEGKIIESNSFYSDPHNLIEKCDFVMANPPFNVSKIDKGKDFVKTDKRLPFGLPKSDNGNYMWIQYFYSYLNKTGRAGFVMASSATDAGHSEAAIREKLIKTKHIDCIVSVGNNFFYTRSLPCHLWFLDKGKSKSNEDKILMIDARNVFRKINTTINDFSPGQLLNLTTIIKLYRGEKNVYQNAFAEHQQMLNEYLEKIHEHYKALAKGLNDAAKDLNIDLKVITEIKFDKPAKHQEAENIFKQFNVPVEAASVFINKWQEEIAATEKKSAEKKTDEKEGSSSEVLTKEEKKQISTLRNNITALNKPIIIFSEATKEYSEHTKQGINDWKHFMEWLPDGNYQDIEGLCKIVSLGEIKESEYSLTPGRYVGVSLQLDEGFDYKGRLTEIQEGLDNLNKEANQLAKTISDNFKELAI
ncbi:MAG: N-6 DNA methylase [Cytophagales bacterium]|nr:N-6 DNA methylase [Cytophagales bacterium]